MSAPMLRLYNTLTRTKQDFVPIDPANVRMYACGPTVYDHAHIGNARPVIVFDVLYRLLRHVYGAGLVTYARNITDVDDKINARAARDYPDLPLNAAIAKMTAETEAQFKKDVKALGCLEPDVEPRATGHIPEMRELIERLIDRGVAYVAEDHVLFSVSAMERLKGVPKYGSLARRPLDEMLAGARVDVAPYKRDPMDFVLWKPSKANEPGWPSPAGIVPQGRPGWHIECSAMAWTHLVKAFAGRIACDAADANVFDIHAGGIDLVFPHHENEIAQSCCALGSTRMANVWMHNGFLQVEGEKMSKSLGNFVTINELLQDWPGEVIRLAMLQTHYREPINWTLERLRKSLVELREWAEIGSFVASDEFKNRLPYSTTLIPDSGVIAALSDDLNSSLAVTRLRELFAGARASNVADAQSLLETMSWFGIYRHRYFAAYSRSMHLADAMYSSKYSSNIQRAKALVLNEYSYSSDYDARLECLRAIKRKANSDPQMTADGVEISITEHCEVQLVPLTASARRDDSKIETLINARTAARAAKNWAESDRIRDELLAKGVMLKDNKDGTTTWELKR